MSFNNQDLAATFSSVHTELAKVSDQVFDKAKLFVKGSQPAFAAITDTNILRKILRKRTGTSAPFDKCLQLENDLKELDQMRATVRMEYRKHQREEEGDSDTDIDEQIERYSKKRHKKTHLNKSFTILMQLLKGSGTNKERQDVYCRCLTNTL